MQSIGTISAIKDFFNVRGIIECWNAILEIKIYVFEVMKGNFSEILKISSMQQYIKKY